MDLATRVRPHQSKKNGQVQILLDALRHEGHCEEEAHDQACLAKTFGMWLRMDCKRDLAMQGPKRGIGLQWVLRHEIERFYDEETAKYGKRARPRAKERPALALSLVMQGGYFK
ncbi:hypothetical protein HAX54_034622 [Datura stramonium]|uniref:Uncharacterized protein n=1 Tax=Datura stramonium TaxID=4076 RepID=A0ABS8VFR7_DATST|nr:hypothetical protein [Datura stramonium]